MLGSVSDLFPRQRSACWPGEDGPPVCERTPTAASTLCLWTTSTKCWKSTPWWGGPLRRWPSTDWTGSVSSWREIQIFWVVINSAGLSDPVGTWFWTREKRKLLLKSVSWSGWQWNVQITLTNLTQSRLPLEKLSPRFHDCEHRCETSDSHHLFWGRFCFCLWNRSQQPVSPL